MMEMEEGEAGGEVAAAEEGADGGDGIGTQGAEGAAVVGLVGGEASIYDLSLCLLFAIRRIQRESGPSQTGAKP